MLLLQVKLLTQCRMASNFSEISNFKQVFSRKSISLISYQAIAVTGHFCNRSNYKINLGNEINE